MTMKLSTKGKKALKISSIIASILVALVAVVAVVFVLLSPKEIPTYSFSGYVYADGVAVEGATVSCGVMKTETNSDGYYCFEGLKSVVEVTVEKDNFLFGGDLVYVSNNCENINFSGFEIFSMNGVVRNGQSVVPYADIVVVSELGEYKTRADAFGKFSLPKLAGKVELRATSEGVELFSQSFDKFKNDELVVACQTSVSGKVSVDYDGEYDFVLTLNGEEISLNENLEFKLDGISPKSVLKLESDNYYLDKSEFVINVENGFFEFNAQKFFTLKGYVKSGNVPLHNVRIVAGKNKAYSLSDGYFEIPKLYGEVEVSSSLRGYNFSKVTCSNESNEHNFSGNFTLSGRVSVDNGIASGIRVVCGDKVAVTNSIGRFELKGVSLGEEVYVDSAEYFVKNGSVEVSSTKDIVFDLEKKYDLKIYVTSSGSPLENVSVEVADETYTTNSEGLLEVAGLHGANLFTASKAGYRFDANYVSDYMHTEFEINADEYYVLSGVVASGEKVLENATIIVEGSEYSTNESGQFSISQLYKSGIATITCQGFDTTTINYSLQDNEHNVNLTYGIEGQVLCGATGVGLVEVSYLDNEKQTQKIITDYNGNFDIQGLCGMVELSFEKDYYTIEKNNVFGYEDIDINSTYSICGKAFNSEGNIEGLKIGLLQNTGSDAFEDYVMTNANGEFSFDGLSGEYLLMYDSSSGYELLPNTYQITEGGIYNFADNGYSIKGCVTSGGEPVSGVVVSAGEYTAITNDRGYYKFDLLIAEEELILTKDGYDFGESIIVNSSFDGREDVNFVCTYSVQGVVCSGETPISGVTVEVGGVSVVTNESGQYLINGIEGTKSITLSKSGYEFDGVSEVSTAGEYNYDAHFTSEITVVSRDVIVSGASVEIAGATYTTNELGKVNISNLHIGDVLQFSKQGYNIDEYIFEDNVSSVVLNATYSVAGKVLIVSQPLVGVRVLCGEQVFVTNSAGEFLITGISGLAEISFEKDSYEFESVQVSGYRDLEIRAMFGISGYVNVTGVPLSGVSVTAGDKSSITDNDGYFEINGLTDTTLVEFEKYGYTFVGENYVSEPTILDITARYNLSGQVKSGELAIVNAQISLSTGEVTYSDDNGYYLFTGLVDIVDVTVSKTGYDSSRIEGVDKFSNSTNFDLTYSIVINFTGAAGVGDISISVNEVANKYSSSSVKLDNLKGESYISIDKDGYGFNPSQLVVSQYTEYSVAIMKEFSVSGTIRTTSGVAVANAPIVAGKNVTITDANGYYCLSGLTGTVRPSIVLDVVDNAYKGENFSYSVSLGQFDSDTTINYNNITDFDYSYYMFKKGYANLYNANSYQIFGSGSVHDSASGENQDVNIVYKKDTNNKRIMQNLNWHDGKILGIVDPRVSQLTYVDMTTKTVKWQKITEGSVGKDANTTAYTTSWNTTDYDSYLNSFGVNAEGFYPYVINRDTINSSLSVNLTYDVGSGLYKFEFNLLCNEAMYKYYVIQMSNMCSSQSFQSFNSAKLTYTINNKGFITQMDIDEVYKVKASVFSSTVTDDFTYYFKTTSLNEVISDIDISSLAAIRDSLSEKTPTIKVGASRTSDYDVDLYYDKRRVLV